MIDLNTAWYLLIGVLLVGYAVLDGFDLGVGVWSLFVRSEEERRVYFHAIGPVWDGNEVWLLTAGGALFAAFPMVYATVFSGFYLPFMLLVVALIFRAVAIEFYGQIEAPGWRRIWGWAFGVGSLVPSILFGVAFGNILRGIPMDARHDFAGSFWALLNPYALLLGLLSLAMFLMHGAAYMTLKTGGSLRDQMHQRAIAGWVAVAVLYVPATLFTVIVSPFLFQGLAANRLFYLALAPLIIAIPCVPAALNARKYGWAFVASAVTMASMIAMAGVSLYPRLAPCRTDPLLSLTIYNAVSTPRTLTVMLVIALIGMPIVLAYTAFVYWVFRGKVSAGEQGY
jgi:cytochrome d ubiquinol oxidase subunit II